jgi:glycosyltransferase involved in cell wall biosynthesis
LQGSLKNNKKLSQFKCVLPERATFWGYTSELAANKSKMRILYIVHEMYNSGASISFLNLVRGIKAKGCEILVVAPNYISDVTKVSYQFVSQMVSMQIPYMQIPIPWEIMVERNFEDKIKNEIKKIIIGKTEKILPRERRKQFSKKILLDIINEFNPDIVHTNLGVIHVGYEVCQQVGIPHVWHLRDYHDLDFGWTPMPSWDDFKKQLKKSDAVITITNDIRKHFDLWNSPNALTIYNGCFDASDTALDFPKEKYFFCASRLIETKGHDDVVRAFDLFFQNHSDYQLVLAGTGDDCYISHLNKLISSLSCRDSIKFVGHQNNVRPFMRKAMALVVASYNEGFGRMTAEAASCGCLVIGRYTGGTKEILDEIGGFPFDNSDAVQGIFQNMEKIVSLSENAYREIAEKAQRKAVKLYSNESYVEQVYAVYQRLLEKKQL